jgi:hypothetical protein
LSWQLEPLEGPTHRRDTDPAPLAVCHPGTELLQSDVRHGADHRANHRLSDRIQPALLATGVRFWCHVPRAPVTAEEFFDERHTDPEQVGESVLGAKPSFVGLDNLEA